VFSTAHTSSVAETCQRLVAAYDQELQAQARQDILQAMKVVVAQRLVRSTDGRRVALREYLIFDEGLKRELAEATNLTQSVRAAVHAHGRPMIRAAEEALEKGLISPAVRDEIAFDYGKK